MIKIFNDLTSLQKSLAASIVAIVLFIASAGASYSAFSKTGVASPFVSPDVNVSLPTATSSGGENPQEPKTAECPLNGSMHTEKAKAAWVGRRPLAVMIENHTEARPQSGLSSADVVYEAVAEGGITRFMAVFLCNLSDVQVGPVRSARTYFLDWLSEYNALYAHVGGANSPGPANALGQIIKYSILDLNQFGIGFPTYWRDYQRLGHSVATEHTMYSTVAKLWKIGSDRGWGPTDNDGQKWDASFIPWKFKNDSAASPVTTPSISVDFWQGYSDYSVAWKYDSGCNCYQRSNGSSSHLDLDNNQQLTAKNIVVQFEKESHANDGYPDNVHLLYGTIGRGKALIFQDGKAIEGSWVKSSRLGRSKYLDASGKEILFNRGLIWIQTVPEGSSVKY